MPSDLLFSIKKIRFLFLLISLIVTPVLVALSQVTPFPVACYNFDGSLINDDPSVGIADLGSLNNLGFYESGAGICYGTDSVYVFGQGDGLDLSKNNLPTETYSLELFFQFTSLSASPSGRRRILRFKSENDAGLYLSPEGRLLFQSDNNQSVLDSGATVINEGEWMNISISRDGAVVPPEIIIYLNGKEEIRVPTDNSTELLNDFKIFEDNSGGDPLYKDENASGKIDYLRFYSEALDATQIDDLFSEGQIKSDMLITPTPSSTICVGETITLTASGGDGTYNWNTGETTISINVSPLDTTVYWVESTIQSPCDRKCFKLRDSLTVNVVQYPTVAITASTPACINDPITISYVGSADLLAATFDWNFAGGSVVNTGGETYNVTWNSSGTKTVNLRVIENGCFADAFLSVQVYTPPTSTFSLPTSVCTPQAAAINYSGTGTASATYTWDFDGGTVSNIGGQNYTVVWSDLVATTKTVSLTVTENGCSTTTLNTITVNPTPTSTFTIPTGACIQDALTVAYTGTANPLTATFDWNFAGGSVVNTGGETYNVTWNSSGTKTVTLRVSENGCFSDTIISVQIYTPPTSTFSLPSSACTLQPTTVSYTGTGTALATYTWGFDGGVVTNIGGENYSVIWNDLVVTTKTVSLTVTENGCSTTTSNTITVNPTPTSTFTIPTGACIQDNLAVTYTGTANPTTATFNWNFDGASFTQTAGTQDYNLSWATGGTKTISLTVTENGCVSTQTVATVTVNNFSNFTITSNQGAICDTGTILVTFTGSYEPLATLNWDFGGGAATQIAGTNNYTVIWPTVGVKTVTLDIIGDQCPDNSSSETITVFATPTSDFSLNNSVVCLGDPVTISYTGTASPSATYNWNFGGGQFAKGAGESYVVIWDTGGAKTISLTVTENGCSSTVTSLPITVNNDSNFDVSVPGQSCITDPVTVTFVGFAETGATLSWNFDGGTATSIGTEVYEVTWPTSGVKNISLNILGVACPDVSTVKTITVGAIPALDFSSPAQACASQSATVMYNGINTIGKKLTWDFGDASTVDSVAYEQYNITWSTIGIKSINVSINDYGCVQSTTLQVEVLPTPTALFTIGDFVCTNTNNAIGYSGTGTALASYTWGFDGGVATATSGLENYDVSWSTMGVKNISLSVTENNCTSLIYTDSITVVAPETFLITADNDIVCEGDNNQMTFEGLAEIDALYIWNFDDGLANQINGQEVYDVNWATPGTKSVTLVVIGAYCVSDTISKTITVLPKPDPTFSVDPAVCINLAANINYNAIPDLSWVFTWDFDGGVSTSVGNEDYSVVWSTGGFKIITLSINNSGCITEVFTDTIQVNNYAQFDVTPDQDVICAGETVNFQFVGSREAGATLTWDFDDGIINMVTDEEYNVSWLNTGFKNIVLTVNGITCPDSDTTRVISINNKPIPTFTAPDAICLAESANIIFTGQADTLSSFNWIFDNGLDTQIIGAEEYNVTWPDIGSKLISLQINNNNGDTTSIGCLSDIEIDTVSVLDFSLFNSALDSICADEILTIDFSNNDPLPSSVAYTWDFDGADYISGTGLGPYELSWSNTNFGNKVIRLDIQGLYCGSDSLIHEVYVEENLIPSMVIGVDSIYCSVNDVLIVPSMINEGLNPEYRWFVNDQFISSDTAFSYSGLVDGDKVYGILTSSIKCVTSRNVLSNAVIVNISDFAFIGDLVADPNPICPGESAVFSIDTYAGIQWQESFGDGVWIDMSGETSSQLVVSPDTELYYRAVVTDSVCTDISPATLVEIFDITNIDAGEDRTLREGYSIRLQALNGTDYAWSPTTGLNDSTVSNPTTATTESITYYVLGTTIEGCPDIDSLTVTVTPKLGIPNTFTPNGDGANDNWVVDSIDEYPNARIDIYNRWGKQIFNSLGYYDPWNGRFNSQDMAESTYYYVIDLKDGFPQLKGSITILR